MCIKVAQIKVALQPYPDRFPEIVCNEIWFADLGSIMIQSEGAAQIEARRKAHG